MIEPGPENTQKADLLRYLGHDRDALVWKLDGLSDYDVRRPLTPTGTRRAADTATAAGGGGRLGLPLIALAMVPALQFPGWQWISLAVAWPGVTWAAWPFHRAAVINLRHGAATMDTLILVGVLAALIWSESSSASSVSQGSVPG